MSSAPNKYTCESVDKYIVAVEEFKRRTLDRNSEMLFFFRGHADYRWRCLAGIGRSPYEEKAIFHGGADQKTCTDNQKHRNGSRRNCNAHRKTRDAAEWILFSRFRDMSASLEPMWIASVDGVEADWRRVILAQHHGVPTRLLDWTSKSLVALYFSVKGDTDTDSAVLTIAHPRPEVFSVRTLAQHNPCPPSYKYDPNKVGVFWAPDVHQRVTLQGSVFSIRKNPRQAIEPDCRFIIPNRNRQQIRHALYGLGIHEASLFPDLDGIARSLFDESTTWGNRQGVAKP